MIGVLEFYDALLTPAARPFVAQGAFMALTKEGMNELQEAGVGRFMVIPNPCVPEGYAYFMDGNICKLVMKP